MKLASFRTHDNDQARLGVMIQDHLVPAEALVGYYQADRQALTDMAAYLADLPASHDRLKELVEKVTDDPSALDSLEKYQPDRIKFLPAVPNPSALLDFALSPRHIRNSARTMIKHEKKWPVSWILKWVIERNYQKNKDRPEFKFYKGNHNTIIGDMDQPVWPKFCSYLDVEPELGIVTGPAALGASSTELEQAIAGYLIFNDFSARDIQWPEMVGMSGPTRSKDLEKGNALGPFLVTPDEVPNPLNLNVRVDIGDRLQWHGSTSEYTARPLEVLEYLASFRSLPPGMVIGMGTIPDCCGLDRDEWLRPGDLVEITFERLGTLRQIIPSDPGPLEPSRWVVRDFDA
jgi:2-keto-4-pentenoate hydratase/2-oxohepta-3-ene-1,7-dioic acid hydratase in catechol pathway